jgi:hypothetical protein
MSEPSAVTFQRPFRPFVARVYNALAGLLRCVGLRYPLRAEQVLRRACKRTGLSDFGGDSFREGLERLLCSLEQDARVGSMARAVLRYYFTLLLKMRLYLQQWVTQEPTILEEEVRHPIFVVGFPRTGTTLLHNLLCQDRRGRPLLLWEVLEPIPPPGFDPGIEDPRIGRGRQYVWVANRFGAPQFTTIHPLNAEGPEECSSLLLYSFRSPGFLYLGGVRSYMDWLRDRGEEDRLCVYREYRRQLQLMQWRRPGRHWVLKSPMHLWGLDALLQVFPDAHVIQTHRAMNKVIPSIFSLQAVSRGVFSDYVDCHQIGKEIGDYHHHFFEPMVKARAAHPGRVFDLQYADLVRDPVAAVQSIYEHFQIAPEKGMEERMRRWLADNPQNKHGVHRYTLGQFGLTEADIDKWFGDYQEQYGIRPEAVRV